MTSAPHDLRGQVLGGRYRIGSVLGRGGMGTVYEAVQESLGRRVAVKVLHPALSSDADAVARFRKEAEQAGALSHPHIVHVLDFGYEAGGLAWIAMERLEGESLGQKLGRSGALPQRAVVPIALETLSALQAAHELRLVHRDLKPDNIFLARAAGVGEVVKILDFGIAKLLDGGAAAALTATGMVVGTPLYMSPEQAQGKTVDARADLYSLGAVLYEALSGKTPFEADSYTALLITIVTQPAPSLAQSGAEVDPRLAAIVDRVLSKDPALRFASALEMADAIRALRISQHIDPEGRSAVATAAGPPLALAETVQGSATPPVAPSPVSPVATAGSTPATPAGTESQAGAPAPGGRRPLVRLRWPRSAGIGTIIVAVVAVFSWVGLRQGSQEALLSPTATVGSAGTIAPAGAPPIMEGRDEAVAPTPPGLPPTTPAIARGDGRAHGAPQTPLQVAEVPSKAVGVLPGKVGVALDRPRLPAPGVGVRIRPSSFMGRDVSNMRSAFRARSDWSSCWPARVAPPTENRGRCLRVTISASGQVTGVTNAGRDVEPVGLLTCLIRRTRAMTFEPPTTGEEATAQVCFSIEPPRR